MSIPIPHRPSGFMLGDPAAQVTIDAFIDIQCPYSRETWPTLLNVLKHYHNHSLNLKVHMISLSNHRQSWDMTLGLFALADGDTQKFYDFTTFVYERQETFFNGAFLNKTHADLKQLVADFAKQHANINSHDFNEKISDDDIYTQARTPVRYAATKSVWATPTLFINNADDVPISYNATVADWQKILNPLLGV